MIVLLLSAAGAIVSSGSTSTPLTCSLELADRSRFLLKGHFNEERLDSNLSDLTRVEGDFEPAPYEIVVTSDGTRNYRWRMISRTSVQKFDASLTRYGSEASILLVERQKFVGRHWGRSLVGVGFCDVGSSQSGEKAS